MDNRAANQESFWVEYRPLYAVEVCFHATELVPYHYA